MGIHHKNLSVIHAIDSDLLSHPQKFIFSVTVYFTVCHIHVIVTLPISYLDNSSQYLPFFSFKNV